MATSRPTREGEMVRNTRESEKRDHNMLMEYSMGYVSPLDLPRGLARDGYTYYWAARELAGQPTYEVEELCARGWEIVPSDRCPHYNSDPLKRHPYSSQYLCYKGLILMERPEIYHFKEQEALYRFNNHRLNSLEGVKQDMPSMRSSAFRTITSF